VIYLQTLTHITHTHPIHHSVLPHYIKIWHFNQPSEKEKLMSQSPDQITHKQTRNNYCIYKIKYSTRNLRGNGRFTLISFCLGYVLVIHTFIYTDIYKCTHTHTHTYIFIYIIYYFSSQLMMILWKLCGLSINLLLF
jgi:hypothetical protein